MNSKVLLILVDGMRPDAIPACGSEKARKCFNEALSGFSFQPYSIHVVNFKLRVSALV